MTTTPQFSDVSAERAILGSVWLSHDIEMVGELEAGDFTDPFNQWLLRMFKLVVEDGDPLDMIAVQRRWQKEGGTDGLTESEVAQLPTLVGELLAETHTAAHTEYYYRVLRTERLRRAVGMLADALVKRSAVLRHEPTATLAWAGEQIDYLLTKVPVIVRERVSESVLD